MLQERFETASEKVAPIFYREVGAGSPLLLIHGSFSNGPTTWARQMEEIRHYHRLIVVDRRGHGQSPAEPRPYTIAGDAVDVLEAADRAGGGEIHVVGHSYGGMVALEMARIEPHRIRSLHLIEPPYLSLMPEDSDVSSVIGQGQSIFRNAAIVGPEGTATAFMEMLIGSARVGGAPQAERSGGSPREWAGLAGHRARGRPDRLRAVPCRLSTRIIGRAERRFPGSGLYRRAQPSRSAKAGAPAGRADPKRRTDRGAGRDPRGAAIHRAFSPGAAWGHGRQGQSLVGNISLVRLIYSPYR